MARYGRFKYSEAKYGATTSDSLSWGLEIDWIGNGTFSGENEGLYLTDLQVRRGREFYMRTDYKGFQPVQVGEFIATLDNSNGRFTPYNTSSPLYPKVRPGTIFRIKVKDNSTGIVYSIMTGTIDDIQPVVGKENKVIIKGSDRIKILKQKKVTVPLYQNIDTEDAINLTLSGTSWAYPRSIDTGGDTLLYWWANDQPAWNTLNDIADANLGKAYINASGVFCYQSRTHEVTSSATIVPSDYQNELMLMQPWETLRNDVAVVVHPRKLIATTPIWTLDDIPYLYPGSSGTVTIWAQYNYNMNPTPLPAKDVISPVATTDYTANTAEDGSGDNRTANLSVSAINYAGSSELILTNTGADGFYVTLLQIRGKPLENDDSFEIRRKSNDSISLYGSLPFTVDSNWMQDSNVADSFSSFLSNLLIAARSFPKIAIVDDPAKQFGLDLFDGATVTLPGETSGTLYQVGQITHNWMNRLGNIVKTTYQFEVPIEADTPASGWWRFTTQLGISSTFAY